MWCWSGREKIPHAQGQRRSPSKMVEAANSRLESNPLPPRDAQRAQTNLVHNQKPGSPQRQYSTVFVSCGGAGQQWTATGAGLRAQQTWVWHKRSWRRWPSTPPLHRTGKQTLGWHTQNLVHTRTQEKGAVTPQEPDPDLPVRVQASPM